MIILTVTLYLMLQMTGVWIIYYFYKNPSVVDVWWPIGLVISGLIYLGSSALTHRHLIIGFLLVLWGIRLAAFLGLNRLGKGHVDKRYTQLTNNWNMNHSFGFFINFQFQALLIWSIAFIFYWIAKDAEALLSGLDYWAVLFLIVGIGGESLADYQLKVFKSYSKTEVCNVGLWRYSRHPNYFFDWMSWCGFSLFALHAPNGSYSIISLIILLIIFIGLTGPLTEKSSIQSKGQKYLHYQKQTSMFFPWFKKKS